MSLAQQTLDPKKIETLAEINAGLEEQKELLISKRQFAYIFWTEFIQGGILLIPDRRMLQTRHALDIQERNELFWGYVKQELLEQHQLVFEEWTENMYYFILKKSQDEKA